MAGLRAGPWWLLVACAALFAGRLWGGDGALPLMRGDGRWIFGPIEPLWLARLPGMAALTLLALEVCARHGQSLRQAARVKHARFWGALAWTATLKAIVELLATAWSAEQSDPTAPITWPAGLVVAGGLVVALTRSEGVLWGRGEGHPMSGARKAALGLIALLYAALATAPRWAL